MAARIIEAKAIISASDQTGAAFAAVSKKIQELGSASKAAAQAQRELGSIDAFRAQHASLIQARARFRETQVAVEAAARAMKAAEGPSAALARAYEQAQRAVRSASSAFERQAAVVSASRAALEAAGAPITRLAAHEAKLKAAIDSTTAAMQRQSTVSHRLAMTPEKRAALGNAAAGAGIYAGYKTKEFGKKAVVSVAEFDIGVRKQRAFTDIGEAEQAPLIAQAKRIGQDTQFTNLDVVKAQTKAMQGLPANFTASMRAEVAQGILENVKNYALVMEADLEKSAEALRSYLQTTGRDISTKEKALKEANKATNQLVRMAKLGGMSDEDVQQYMKYAGSSGNIAGLNPESMMALGAVARRGGLRGDEAGTFIRTLASKMVSPTKGGLTALSAAGINHSDYVKMPERLDVGNLEGQFKRDLGKSFSPAARKRLEGILANKALLSDRGKFTEAVTEAVSDMFGKTKKGKLRPADRVNIAKSAGNFHKLSAQSVDTEALLDAIMASKMTLAQLNEFLTNKHGGKGAITQQQRVEYNAARSELQKAGNDPDFAKKKADEIMGGIGGEFERLKGSVENLFLAFGQANEFWLKPAMAGMGAALDGISNSSGGAKAALSLLAVSAGYSAKALGAIWLLRTVLGTGGTAASATALTGSATALGVAAEALTVAAGRLGLGTAAGAAASGAGTAAGAGAGTAAATWGSRLMMGGRILGGLGIGVGAGLGVWDLYEANRGNAGMTGNQRLRRDRGGKSMRDTFRQEFDSERARFGLAPTQGWRADAGDFAGNKPSPMTPSIDEQARDRLAARMRETDTLLEQAIGARAALAQKAAATVWPDLRPLPHVPMPRPVAGRKGLIAAPTAEQASSTVPPQPIRTKAAAPKPIELPPIVVRPDDPGRKLLEDLSAVMERRLRAAEGRRGTFARGRETLNLDGRERDIEGNLENLGYGPPTIANRGNRTFSLAEVRAALYGPGGTPEAPASGPVTAELHGSAEVKGETTVTVKVEAGSELLRVIERAKQTSVAMSGRLNAGAPGSTGRTMPEAAAGGVGSSPY